MGTSTSTNGPKGINPLLPPWVEKSEDLLLTHSNGKTENIDNNVVQNLLGKPFNISVNKNRFLTLRNKFSKYLHSEDKKDLLASLTNYSQASGGGKVIAKRLASAIKSGASLLVVLSGGSASYDNNKRSLSIKDLQNLTVDQAIDKLTEFLTPTNPDSEYVRNALDDALSKSLEGEELFDQITLDNERLEKIINYFLINLILNDVINVIGISWKNCDNPENYMKRQNELSELISVIVNDTIYGLIKQKGNIKNLSAVEIIKLQQELISTSVQNWAKYFDEEED